MQLRRPLHGTSPVGAIVAAWIAVALATAMCARAGSDPTYISSDMVVNTGVECQIGSEFDVSSDGSALRIFVSMPNDPTAKSYIHIDNVGSIARFESFYSDALMMEGTYTHTYMIADTPQPSTTDMPACTGNVYAVDLTCVFGAQDPGSDAVGIIHARRTTAAHTTIMPRPDAVGSLPYSPPCGIVTCELDTITSHVVRWTADTSCMDTAVLVSSCDSIKLAFGSFTTTTTTPGLHWTYAAATTNFDASPVLRYRYHTQSNEWIDVPGNFVVNEATTDAPNVATTVSASLDYCTDTDSGLVCAQFDSDTCTAHVFTVSSHDDPYCEDKAATSGSPPCVYTFATATPTYTTTTPPPDDPDWIASGMVCNGDVLYTQQPVPNDASVLGTADRDGVLQYITHDASTQYMLPAVFNPEVDTFFNPDTPGVSFSGCRIVDPTTGKIECINFNAATCSWKSLVYNGGSISCREGSAAAVSGATCVYSDGIEGSVYGTYTHADVVVNTEYTLREAITYNAATGTTGTTFIVMLAATNYGVYRVTDTYAHHGAVIDNSMVQLYNDPVCTTESSTDPYEQVERTATCTVHALQLTMSAAVMSANPVIATSEIVPPAYVGEGDSILMYDAIGVSVISSNYENDATNLEIDVAPDSNQYDGLIGASDIVLPSQMFAHQINDDEIVPDQPPSDDDIFMRWTYGGSLDVPVRFTFRSPEHKRVVFPSVYVPSLTGADVIFDKYWPARSFSGCESKVIYETNPACILVECHMFNAATCAWANTVVIWNMSLAVENGLDPHIETVQDDAGSIDPTYGCYYSETTHTAVPGTRLNPGIPSPTGVTPTFTLYYEPAIDSGTTTITGAETTVINVTTNEAIYTETEMTNIVAGTVDSDTGAFAESVAVDGWAKSVLVYDDVACTITTTGTALCETKGDVIDTETTTTGGGENITTIKIAVDVVAYQDESDPIADDIPADVPLDTTGLKAVAIIEDASTGTPIATTTAATGYTAQLQVDTDFYAAAQAGSVECTDIIVVSTANVWRPPVLGASYSDSAYRYSLWIGTSWYALPAIYNPQVNTFYDPENPSAPHSGCTLSSVAGASTSTDYAVHCAAFSDGTSCTLNTLDIHFTLSVGIELIGTVSIECTTATADRPAGNTEMCYVQYDETTGLGEVAIPSAEESASCPGFWHISGVIPTTAAPVLTTAPCRNDATKTCYSVQIGDSGYAFPAVYDPAVGRTSGTSPIAMFSGCEITSSNVVHCIAFRNEDDQPCTVNTLDLPFAWDGTAWAASSEAATCSEVVAERIAGDYMCYYNSETGLPVIPTPVSSTDCPGLGAILDVHYPARTPSLSLASGIYQFSAGTTQYVISYPYDALVDTVYNELDPAAAFSGCRIVYTAEDAGMLHCVHFAPDTDASTTPCAVSILDIPFHNDGSAWISDWNSAACDTRIAERPDGNTEACYFDPELGAPVIPTGFDPMTEFDIGPSNTHSRPCMVDEASGTVVHCIDLFMPMDTTATEITETTPLVRVAFFVNYGRKSLADKTTTGSTMMYVEPDADAETEGVLRDSTDPTRGVMVKHVPTHRTALRTIMRTRTAMADSAPGADDVDIMMLDPRGSGWSCPVECPKTLDSVRQIDFSTGWAAAAFGTRNHYTQYMCTAEVAAAEAAATVAEDGTDLANPDARCAMTRPRAELMKHMTSKDVASDVVSFKETLGYPAIVIRSIGGGCEIGQAVADLLPDDGTVVVMSLDSPTSRNISALERADSTIEGRAAAIQYLAELCAADDKCRADICAYVEETAETSNGNGHWIWHWPTNPTTTTTPVCDGDAIYTAIANKFLGVVPTRRCSFWSLWVQPVWPHFVSYPTFGTVGAKPTRTVSTWLSRSQAESALASPIFSRRTHRATALRALIAFVVDDDFSLLAQHAEYAGPSSTTIIRRAGDWIHRFSRVPFGRLDASERIEQLTIWKGMGYTNTPFGMSIANDLLVEAVFGDSRDPVYTEELQNQLKRTPPHEHTTYPVVLFAPTYDTVGPSAIDAAAVAAWYASRGDTFSYTPSDTGRAPTTAAGDEIAADPMADHAMHAAVDTIQKARMGSLNTLSFIAATTTASTAFEAPPTIPGYIPAARRPSADGEVSDIISHTIGRILAAPEYVHNAGYAVACPLGGLAYWVIDDTVNVSALSTHYIYLEGCEAVSGRAITGSVVHSTPYDAETGIATGSYDDVSLGASCLHVDGTGTTTTATTRTPAAIRSMMAPKTTTATTACWEYAYTDSLGVVCNNVPCTTADYATPSPTFTEAVHANLHA